MMYVKKCIGCHKTIHPFKIIHFCNYKCLIKARREGYRGKYRPDKWVYGIGWIKNDAPIRGVGFDGGN